MNQPINYEDKKLTIKQWSVQDRPREKYAKNGALALSDAELIAILLRTGNPNDSASGKTLRELSDVKGIGQAKAISLLSAFELGKRMRAEKVEECLQIRSSTDVVNLMQDKIADLEHEEFWAIYLNQANRILSTVQISRGGISSTPVDTRIVLQQAVLNKATQFVLCHNHPSGSVKPSRSDIQLTERLQRAAEVMDLVLVDHLIIHRDDYYSFAEDGRL